MPTIQKDIIVQQELTKVFDLAQDYTARLQWDKYLRKAVLIDADKPTIGVSTYCESRKGVGMTAKYITFNRPTQTAMQMTKGPFIFKKFSGSWRFTAVDAQHTKVIFRYNVELKHVFKIFNPIIIQLLRTDLKNRLHYLKIYAEKL